MSQYLEDNLKIQYELFKEKSYLPMITPSEKVKLQRHCVLIVDDLEKSKFLAEKHYLEIKK